ncbi:porin [Paraburkholderia aspalathi]|uniref:porin n=1 Tax=Paraburkholderia aspalathi TaxID=1324617 RepID=UPI0038BC06E6
MKKTLIIAAIGASFAPVAQAQGSVTLYGLIDAGITYTNNQGGHRAWQETSGSINGSRWGLRGSEDLGGDLKAIFTLENGFGINNGTLKQSGREFGRQAFVGLASDQFGAVTLGRQYDSVVNYLAPLALTGTQYGGTLFAHPFANDNLNNAIRINNSLKYSSANCGGVRFGALYGLSSAADSFANNRAYSIGGSYTYGRLRVAAAYLQLNNYVSAVTTTRLNVNGAIPGDNTFVAGRQRTWGGGVSYTLGAATVGVVYTQTNLRPASDRNPEAVSRGNVGTDHFQNVEVNARYTFKAGLNLAGSYTYTRADLDGMHPKFNQFNLQVAYTLSKRTDVYLHGEYQRVNRSSGIAARIDGLGDASSTTGQVAVSAGLRHRF